MTDYRNEFLPLTPAEVAQRGWTEIDFLLITGDAYVDHPSFGTAIIGRVLEAKGYRVAILSQPNWRNLDNFRQFGQPRLGIMINAGNIDSMVAHYTAAKKKRSDDAYSPGGKAGFRPDRALIVYTNRAREAFPQTPIIVGGLEASLRRFAHYDYWQDDVRQSVLFDCGADLLSFGMGENQTIQIADRLAQGESIDTITDVLGTCYISATPIEGCFLPSYEDVCRDKKQYAKAARMELDEQDHIRGKRLIQKHGNRFLVQNPPMPPLTTDELDWVYSLPYMRYYHPSYEAVGGVPAIEEVEFSITHNRGCFGACNFCSLAFHQGRFISCRSEQSVLDEAKRLTQNPRFKGYIHDVGGPTANFRFPACRQQLKNGLCKGKKCLAPTPCKNLIADHQEYLAMLRKLRAIPKVKKVFIRSGIRFDYLMADQNDTFFKELVAHHISGQLKVAPEHCSAAVLDAMGKPHIETYLAFQQKYYAINHQLKQKQYLVPYLMSSHPGSRLQDAVELALFLKQNHLRPQQVQDFYPTPGTISTAMFYTELDPYALQPIFVPKTPEQKAAQRAMLQYFRPENQEVVRRALLSIGRKDLIGNGEKCLVPPAKHTAVHNSSKFAKKPNKKAGNQWNPKKGKK
ncbi:MAG: YgiQ family radical SAM protein [Clostridia bacterium]|nr:YgiQ family radical SAM protein [Clostridia bacterium]